MTVTGGRPARRLGGPAGWRGVVFDIAMAVFVFATVALAAPVALFMSRRRAHAVAVFWVTNTIRMLRAISGIEVEIRGRENIPKGAAMVASKHQSTLETFVLARELDDAVFVLKRELLVIPFFGWFLARLDMIAIDRRGGADALAQMLEQATVAVGEGRQMVIFPEGTRRPVGARPAYKAGALYLYERLQVPCVPVAVDTGLFWPRDGGRRRGRTVIAFLEPIPPGLPRDEFARIMRQRIEDASQALANEAAAFDPAG